MSYWNMKSRAHEHHEIAKLLYVADREAWRKLVVPLRATMLWP